MQHTRLFVARRPLHVLYTSELDIFSSVPAPDMPIELRNT